MISNKSLAYLTFSVYHDLYFYSFKKIWPNRIAKEKLSSCSTVRSSLSHLLYLTNSALTQHSTVHWLILYVKDPYG